MPRRAGPHGMSMFVVMVRLWRRKSRPRALGARATRNQYAFYRRIHKEIIVSVKVGREDQGRSLLTCQARARRASR